MKHTYEGEFNEEKPFLNTCNPGNPSQQVDSGMQPQIVNENEEVIFTYDVIFKVR